MCPAGYWPMVAGYAEVQGGAEEYAVDGVTDEGVKIDRGQRVCPSDCVAVQQPMALP